MDESRVRMLFREAVSSTLARLPAAPAWEELETRASIGVRRRHKLAPLGAALVAVALVVSLWIVGDTAPIGGDNTPPPFDVSIAVEAGRAWWAAVIAGDLVTAEAIAHPDALFNYPGLSGLVSGFSAPAVSVAEDVFGTPVQPQLCFSVEGVSSGLTGSMVYRRYGVDWLLWEVRPGTERCLPVAVNPTTTSTTLPAPTVSARTTELRTSEGVPVREFSIPLRVLAVRPNNPSLALLDFDKGVLSVYPPGSHRLPGDAVDGAVAMPNGAFVVWTQGVARLFPETLDGEVIVLGPTVVRDIDGSAPALRVVPSPDGTLVWLVQPGRTTAGGDIHPTLVELVELPSGAPLGTFELHPDSFPVGATATGLVLNLRAEAFLGPGAPTSGNELVMRLKPDGTVETLYEGRAIAVSGLRIVMILADRLVIGNEDGGGSHDVPKPVPGTWSEAGGPAIPSGAMPLQTLSPDGLRLLVEFGSDAGQGSGTAALYLVDLTTNEATPLADSQGLLYSQFPVVTWSRDGEWIVVLGNQRDIELIRLTDPTERYLLAGVVPIDHYVLAAG